MSHPKLSAAQIEQIVNLEIPAPHTHANLSYPAGIRFLREQIAAEIESIPAEKTFTTEVVLRDEHGRPVLDVDGRVRFVTTTRFARELGTDRSRQFQQILKGQQDEWRQYLQRSNREWARENEDLQRALKSEFGDHMSSNDCAAERESFRRAWLATAEDLRPDFEQRYHDGAPARPLLKPAQAAAE
jgi:hypothetical protein